MDLNRIIQFGYTLIVITIFLMIWISYVESKDLETVRNPPCYFNPLCSCSKAVPDLGIVTCQDFQLPRIPETINISKVFMLHLENNGLRSIPPHFLQSTGLYKIIIRNNPLYTIPHEAFIGLERSLWELELSYTRLISVPYWALKYLQKLRLLDLTGNEINKLQPDSWRGLGHSLEELILAENSINVLPADSFSGLPMVQTIDLRGNNLRQIDPSVFRDGMDRLAHLILADNQLSAIPYQAMQPLKALKTLDLSYNRINKMQPPTDPGVNVNLDFKMNLDEFRLDYNQITILEPASFNYFNVLNRTYLDGNPLSSLEDNAFRQAKIRELYIRKCGLTTVSPAAFQGLENYLEVLDLSGNSISQLPKDPFVRFQNLRALSLEDNILTKLNPTEIFSSFQFTLNKLDLRGVQNTGVSLQDLRRLRSLRTLALSKLSKNTLSPDDFLEFGVDLEELNLNYGNLKTIKNNAFKYVHGLRRIDLSENSIGTLESNAFADIGHSLVSLKMSRAFSSSINKVPTDALKVLTNLEDLDLSNNRIKNMPDTSFHFLKKLKRLELQDNIIELVHKGTFQGDIHSNLKEICLSFNGIRLLGQHAFVQLPKLEQLLLDDNQIETVERRTFMNLESLKRLNMKGNRITSISYESFQNLPELEDLDLSYNRLKSFDFFLFDQVGTLAMLHVNVSHNKILNLLVNVPTALQGSVGRGFHSNIKVLDLSYNNISTISKEFFKPVELSLTHLHLAHNQILNATRDVFGNMPHLQYLDLSKNGMYQMDFDMFRNTKRLQVLLASNNKLAEIPNDLFRFLNNLRVVDFSHNRLRYLPDNLLREEGLERLDISYNMLTKLPLSSLSISAATTLCELDLSWNLISSLSHGGLLQRYKNLNWLDVSHNRLAQIDAGTFKGIPRLASIDLSNNAQLALEPNGLSFQGLEYTLLHLYLDNVSLTKVPALPTPDLVSLSLAHNSLPNVPPEMAINISSLRRLNLNNNDLTAVPIVTHSLPELRYLSMAANPITFLSNNSLLGMVDHLMELDMRYFNLNTLEAGAFCKLYGLKTLKISVSRDLKNFNIPSMLQHNNGLRNLEVNVPAESDNDMDKEMAGDLPPKLRNITFSGKGLKRLGSKILQGIKSPSLHFCLRNTSLLKLQSEIFKNAVSVRNLTVDVRDNGPLKSLLNPSTGSKPGLYRKTFLLDLKMSGNNWACDCDLGWVEVWHRKKRQYLCGDSPSIVPTFTHPDYTCRHYDDDLRISLCANQNNKTIAETLKDDIECGWSASVKITSNFWFIFILFTIVLNHH